VRTERDVEQVRKFLEKRGCMAGIVSKIETPEALENLDGIIDVSDKVLVARGDMGVVLPLEHVPRHQYDIIERCGNSGKFVITATEMLNSMKKSPRPTRAEVNDVFTAVRGGSNAVMLSGETAEGEFPFEAIDYMRRIVESAEGA
jgi:pyruvate kinase